MGNSQESNVFSTQIKAEQYVNSFERILVFYAQRARRLLYIAYDVRHTAAILNSSDYNVKGRVAVGNASVILFEDTCGKK